ncbi:hypothetical protein [Stenotrophomonas sp. PS02289]|uniref:hypothetical protein n=1 Tax=Stenotrophomonas sp. PS02289 TaxID=2991422 RepID=UPI00249CC422|nr:hypothetical protein [Stenotrophomonas sp. PS02289]
MGSKVSFSTQEQDLSAIAVHHQNLTKAVFHYFDNEHGDYADATQAFESIDEARGACLAELEHSSSMAALAAVEAAIRVDFLERVYNKRKDPLSRSMRELHRVKGNRARLEEELLELWKSKGDISPAIISDVRAALIYRHWLAHGRYWLLRAGRNYDFTTVYQVSEALIEGMDAYQNTA